MRLSRLKPYMGPKHYVFKDPDTGRVYQANDQQSLVKLIVAYRAQNELPPIEHLNLVLENYWANLPENAGSAEDGPPLKRGFLAYLRGGIALLDYVFYGDASMVSQEVADARAKICLGCPHNVFPDKGAFLSWSDDIAEACTGGKKAADHDKLGNCDVCSCPLRAKVFYKGPFTCTKEELEKFPDFCWQKKEHLKKV